MKRTRPADRRTGRYGFSGVGTGFQPVRPDFVGTGLQVCFPALKDRPGAGPPGSHVPRPVILLRRSRPARGPTTSDSPLARRGAYRGGVRVVVLDTGFRGYRDHLGKNLPATVEVKSFRADGDIEAGRGHGLACAAVLHTVAPGADLTFVNWEPDRPASFLKAVRWAVESGDTS